jgi:hypothetical protein
MIAGDGYLFVSDAGAQYHTVSLASGTIVARHARLPLDMVGGFSFAIEQVENATVVCSGEVSVETGIMCSVLPHSVFVGLTGSESDSSGVIDNGLGEAEGQVVDDYEQSDEEDEEEDEDTYEAQEDGENQIEDARTLFLDDEVVLHLGV